MSATLGLDLRDAYNMDYEDEYPQRQNDVSVLSHEDEPFHPPLVSQEAAVLPSIPPSTLKTFIPPTQPHPHPQPQPHPHPHPHPQPHPQPSSYHPERKRPQKKKSVVTTPKNDFNKSFSFVILILMALSIHFAIVYMFNEFISGSGLFSSKQELGLRFLYPLSLFFLFFLHKVWG